MKTSPGYEDLQGKVVLITGGVSGIGQAAVRLFAASGCAIGIIDSCEDSVLEAEVSALQEDGVPAQGIRTDISNADAVQAAVAAVTETLGTIDILINNAGVWVSNPLPESSLELFDRHVDVNLKGSYYVSHFCLPGMLDRGGVIINVASVSGTAGRAGDSAYSASKAGVVMLTRTMAAELGPRGIRINCICPGAVATPLTAALRTPEGEKQVEALMSGHPSPNRRFFMPPKDIAELAVFLASNKARAIHGAVIAADEGLTATM